MGLEIDESNLNQYQRLASQYEEMGNAYQAIMILRRGIKNKVLKKKALLEMSRVAQRMGDSRKAWALLKEGHEFEVDGVRNMAINLVFKMGSEGHTFYYKEFLKDIQKMYPDDQEVKEVKEFFKI
jgi:hypothetical protein